MGLKSISTKLTKSLVFCDEETTGLDISKDEIVQFYAIRLEPDGTSKTLEFICKPSIPIPVAASSVHHITNEMVANKHPFVFYVKQIEAFFKDADIAGYNILSFDLKILNRQLKEAGSKFSFDNITIYDAYRVFMNHAPRNLAGAVKFYTGKEIQDAHSASGDVLSTIEVMASQLERENLTIDQINQRYKINQPAGGIDSRYLINNGKEYLINFGKHKGELLSRVDKSFLVWLLKKDFPENVKAEVKKYV